MDWEKIDTVVVYDNNTRTYLKRNVKQITFDLEDNETRLMMYIEHEDDDEYISND